MSVVPSGAREAAVDLDHDPLGATRGRIPGHQLRERRIGAQVVVDPAVELVHAERGRHGIRVLGALGVAAQVADGGEPGPGERLPVALVEPDQSVRPH